MWLTLDVCGAEIRAFDSGGSGIPLVLLHPGWGDATIWDRVVPLLVPRFRVIRYDNRAYGGSPPSTGPYTYQDDLVSVLDQLGVARATFVGSSGGGGIALGLAVAQPERVDGLVLLAPGVEDYPWPADDPFGREFRTLFEADDVDGLAALGLRTWAAGDPGPEAAAQIRSAVRAFRTQGDLRRPEPPLFEKLDRVRAPAVLLVGSLEYPMVAACCRTIAARVPGCRLVEVRGADHLLPLCVPDRVVEAIRSIT